MAIEAVYVYLPLTVYLRFSFIFSELKEHVSTFIPILVLETLSGIVRPKCLRAEKVAFVARIY